MGVKDVSNCYNIFDISGRVVMFCYDFPDSINAHLEKEMSKEKRIDEAVSRSAAGIILFFMLDEYPMLKYLDIKEL